MKSESYEIVKRARDCQRPTSIDYINNIFDEFVELHGDRRYADDSAVIGGLATIGELVVTVVAIEKGHTPKERAIRNSGAPNPEGYRKALRLMKQAEKFSRPVICFVDTAGAYCGVDAEQRGQGHAIADNLMSMSDLNVPIISILIGEGGSGGALALAVADKVWMLQNAVYSVISPEGCASILWKDSSKAETAADSLKLTAKDALQFGIIEKIIPEDDIGKRFFYLRIKEQIIKEFDLLVDDKNLLENRYNRFRKIGLYTAT